MWQTLRHELHPLGVEIVTVSLESTGADASRDLIDAAHAEHPSLLDPTHQLDALFGVVNIPNVIWIDESGTIVRPPEPGWPSGELSMPPELFTALPELGSAPAAPQPPDNGPGQWDVLGSGQDRGAYVEALRDWAARGADSRFVMSPADVVAASQPRSDDSSTAAAHFEMANHLWSTANREAAIEHFNECHRLDPDNWTYKRQAWSLVGREQVDGRFGPFVQAPLAGEESKWPFASDFTSDVLATEVGAYYPATL